MINPSCPFDSTQIEEVSYDCMMCGKQCETNEWIYTGDEESYMGWEVWVYCKECNIETFRIIKPKQEDAK